MLDKTEYQIIGNDLQALNINLVEGKSILANPGSLVCISENIEMKPTLGKETIIKRLIGGFKRTIVGEKFFLMTFKTISGLGEIIFSSPVPGKIVPVVIPPEGIICEKQAYLCSDPSINIEIAFARRLGTGLFGKEGFILQKLTGEGTAFIQASGMIIRKTLNEGERIKLDPGCVVAFDASVDYNIKYVGSLKNAVLSGLGLFFVTLTGPGNVFIQTMPLYKLSGKILSGSNVCRSRSKY